MAAFGDGDPVGKFDPRKDKMPAPVAGIFDEPYVCVPINVDWRGYLIGVIERLAWGDVWEGDEDAQYAAVQEIYKLVNKMQTGGCEVPMLLRQKPGEPCVMEYSNDGGEEWSDAFDFSQCTAIATSETASSIQLSWNVSIEYNEGVIDDWISDPANVYPNFIYDSSPTDDDRDKALCYAIRNYVDMVCEAAISLINDKNQDTGELVGMWRNVASVAGIVSGSLIAVAIFPAAALLAGFTFALSSVLVDIAATILADDPADYEDAEARENVACQMYESLAGSTPTRPQWRNSAGVPLSRASETVRLTVDAANQDRDTFVETLMLFNDAVDVPGDLPDCPCLEEWEYTVDLTAVNGASDGWGVTPGWGVWQIGVGWKALWYEPGDQYRLRVVNEYGSTYTITKYQMTVVAPDPLPVGIDQNVGIAEWDGEQQETYLDTDLLPGTEQYTWTGETESEGVDFNPYLQSEQLFMTSITVFGTGTNPFE